jgi:multisubunit Na+/H+ antiporter MnhG subunit
MNFDLRLPLGLMFTLFGILLTGYGLVSAPDIYKKSLGLNINLGWGLVMLTFGVAMLVLAWRGRAAQAERDL